MLIYCICTQYLVGSLFALITASIRRGMEVISLWHCWGGSEKITEINELFHNILIYWDAPMLLADLPPLQLQFHICSTSTTTFKNTIPSFLAKQDLDTAMKYDIF